MPTFRIIDMKRELEIAGRFTHFSSELIDAMQHRLKNGEQTLLFLNKRGYRRSQVCKQCQQTIKCPHCDLGLTFHKKDDELRCHLCNHRQAVSTFCPSCGSHESLHFKGFGTEHVERSLHALLPGVRTLRMDRDTTQKKTSHEEIYRQFRSHKADVLIGTQMIAKGLHFPSVTLVGILNVDASLQIPEFRAAETTFQLVTQVAGRAGRSSLPGEVLLQTFFPDHPLFEFAKLQNFEAFYRAELEERRAFGFPPFCHLVKITCTGVDPASTEQAALHLHNTLSQAALPGVELFPVTAAGHIKIKDQFRFQFLLKTASIKQVQSTLSNLSSPLPYKIDVDPLHTFF